MELSDCPVYNGEALVKIIIIQSSLKKQLANNEVRHIEMGHAFWHLRVVVHIQTFIQCPGNTPCQANNTPFSFTINYQKKSNASYVSR